MAASSPSTGSSHIWVKFQPPHRRPQPTAGPCDCTQLGVARTEYKYDNKTTCNVGVLYECRGQVSYQHRGKCTDYHGNFFENQPGGARVIHFDRNGDTDDLTTAVLLKQTDGSYSGWEMTETIQGGARKWVVLTKIGQSRFCNACKAWRLDQ